MLLDVGPIGQIFGIVFGPFTQVHLIMMQRINYYGLLSDRNKRSFHHSTSNICSRQSEYLMKRICSRDFHSTSNAGVINKILLLAKARNAFLWMCDVEWTQVAYNSWTIYGFCKRWHGNGLSPCDTQTFLSLSLASVKIHAEAPFAKFIQRNYFAYSHGLLLIGATEEQMRWESFYLLVRWVLAIK